jgi:hypothetical protein
LLVLSIAAAACIVAATAGSGASASALVPLTGETLVASETPVLVGSSDATLSCDPNGTSTISFHVTGGAAGPYPGTFEESGTITLGPLTAVTPTQSTFAPLTFESTFTIFSGDTTITGTKTLTVLAFPLNQGFCGPQPLPGGIIADAFNVDAHLTYTAQINAPTGTATDSGSSYVEYGDEGVRNTGAEDFSFTENYVSTSFSGASTPGKSTGGGQVGAATFGYVAMTDNSGNQKGRCEVVDHLTGTDVRCLDVLQYVQSGSDAFVSGDATVGGTPTHYRIHVHDGGEPSLGADTFEIQTDSGFSAGGPVLAGDVQVH